MLISKIAACACCRILELQIWENETFGSFLSSGDWDPAKLLRFGEIFQLGHDIDTFASLWYNIFFYVRYALFIENP